MSTQSPADRRLSAWLDDEMSVRAPDHLVSEVLAGAARSSRRPAWRIPERWIPMKIAFALAVIPRAVILVATLVLVTLLAAALVVAAQPSPTPYPPGPGRFDAGPELLTPRERHAAVRLLDGRVLVTGGGTRDTEAWDPATGQPRPAGTMAEPRAGSDSHMEAVLLADGRVLVVGGNGPDDLAFDSAEIWDPTTETWASAGSLAARRADHTMTLLDDGRVLVIGGAQAVDGSGPLALTAEIWDPAGGFRPAGTLLHGRINHSATLLDDGRVLVVGGYERFGGPFVPVAELWDPESETFREASALGVPRRYHRAILLADGRVLIVGGGDKDYRPVTQSEMWDPATGTFTPTGLLSGARHQGHTASLLPDGRVLVIGGLGINPEGWAQTSEIWDSATETFTAGADLPTPLAQHSATLLQDGRVLLLGGSYIDAAGGHGAPYQLWTPGSGT